MSSLKLNRGKLTDATNQGIFDNEEFLLSLGNVYNVESLNKPFVTADSIRNYILKPGDFFLALNLVEAFSDSQQYDLQFFLNPTYTGGTALTAFNQLAGSTRQATFQVIEAPTVTNTGTAGSTRKVRGRDGGIFTPSLPATNVDNFKKIVAPNTEILLQARNVTLFGTDVLDLYIRIAEVPPSLEENLKITT